VREDDEGHMKIIDRLSMAEHPSKFFYNILVSNKFIPPAEQNIKWQADCGKQWSEAEWLQCFSNYRTISINNKLRSFKYKFLLRNIPYNQRLHHMGKSDSTDCPKCPNNIESIIHLYWECPEAERIWQCFINFWNYSYNSTVALNRGACLIGIGLDNMGIQKKDKKIFQLLSTLTCYYIHLSKCVQKATSMEGLIYKYLDCYKSEKIIAIRKNRLPIFLGKWDKVGECLSYLVL